MSKEENSYSFSLSVPRQKTFQGKIPNFIPKHSKEKFLSFANTFRKFYLKIEIKRARWQTKDSLLIKNKVCHRSGFADFLGTCVARALFFPFSRSDENMFRSVLIRWFDDSATFFLARSKFVAATGASSEESSGTGRGNDSKLSGKVSTGLRPTADVGKAEVCHVGIGHKLLHYYKSYQCPITLPYLSKKLRHQSIIQ